MMTLFLCLWPFNTSQIVKFQNTQKFIFLILKRLKTVEYLQRTIRKLTTQRNNSLHYGSDAEAEMAATYHSVIGT